MCGDGGWVVYMQVGRTVMVDNPAPDGTVISALASDVSRTLLLRHPYDVSLHTSSAGSCGNAAPTQATHTDAPTSSEERTHQLWRQGDKIDKATTGQSLFRDASQEKPTYEISATSVTAHSAITAASDTHTGPPSARDGDGIKSGGDGQGLGDTPRGAGSADTPGVADKGRSKNEGRRAGEYSNAVPFVRRNRSHADQPQVRRRQSRQCQEVDRVRAASACQSRASSRTNKAP